MSLEENLVRELLAKNNSASDVREIVKYLQCPDSQISRFPPLNLDNDLVETVLQRCEIEKEYNSQQEKMNKNYFKENIKKKVERKILKKEEEILASPKNSHLKIYNKFAMGYCYECKSLLTLRKIEAQFVHFQRLESNMLIPNKKVLTLFDYCGKCGSGLDSDDYITKS